MEIQTTESGSKYYEDLPLGWRKAKRSDFYDDENRAILGKAILCHSIHSDIYYADRTLSRQGIENMMEFVEIGVIYVQE